jgi:hypothetical protein
MWQERHTSGAYGAYFFVCGVTDKDETARYGTAVVENI